MDWKKNLNEIILESAGKAQSTQAINERDEEQGQQFFLLVQESFNEIKAEIEKHGRSAVLKKGKLVVALDIFVGHRLEFTYAVKIHRSVPTALGIHSFFESDRYEPTNSVQRYRFANIHKIDKQRIIRDFMRPYHRHLQAIAAKINNR